jgi:uncharacterized protein YpmS
LNHAAIDEKSTNIFEHTNWPMNHMYADNTASFSLCTNNDAQYRQEVKNFTTWCNINCLVLNVNKTKEMIVDFSKNSSHTPLYIANEQVEVVNDYKYLGVTIDNNFNFNCHVTSLYKNVTKGYTSSGN